MSAGPHSTLRGSNSTGRSRRWFRSAAADAGAGQGLSTMGFPAPASRLPFPPHVFRICSRSRAPVWRGARIVDGPQAPGALPSMASRRLRSRHLTLEETDHA
jgi:hypothetical protein